jgi:hypothetical protein
MTDKPLTKSAKKIINKAVEIAMNTANDKETAFMASHLVQANLPHSKPKTDVWQRKNGNLTLIIQAGINHKTVKSVGLPYGSIPRLLILWIVTEAIRTKSRRIELGSSLAGFMREIGLNPDTGGGKRGDAKRLREQMERLFRAKFSFSWDKTDPKTGAEGYAWLDMQVAPAGELWWDSKTPEQADLFGSWIELGEHFYNAILSAPVPLDLRAIIALKQSSLALDLYMLLSREAYKAEQSKKGRFIPYVSLMEQMGSEYKEPKEFNRKLKAALKSVKAVSPKLAVIDEAGGLRILATSLPPIDQKS